jgi:L-lactate dehydrogenase complex protein LldG
MKSDSSRKQILAGIDIIKNSRRIKTEKHQVKNSDIYKAVLPDLVSCFKNELEFISGKCFLSQNEEEQFKQIKLFLEQNISSAIFCRDLNISAKLKQYNIPFVNDQQFFDGMQSGITGCELLIARTGSVVVTSATESGRQMNVFPPIHIVIADKSQLVEYPEDAFIAIQKKYKNFLPSTITTITGPSRTADIEKTLVLGAHGPKEFVIFLRLN